MEFKDHVVQNPDLYKVTNNNDGTYTIVPTWVENPEEIIQQGTTIDAATFEEIYARINGTVDYDISSFTYNIGSGLQKYRGAPFPKIVIWGDSITAGAGGQASWDTGWVQQFEETLQLSKGSMYGRGYLHPGVLSGWTMQENVGLNHYTAVGTDVTTAVIDDVWNNVYSRKTDVLYSKKPDGGTLEILVDGVVSATVSCNAATVSFANVVTVDVPEHTTFSVRAIGKAYVEGFVDYAYNGLADGILVHGVGHGGDAAVNFTDEEIQASIGTFSPDLTCIGMITNDFGLQTIDLFRTKIQKAIDIAKTSGDVLLFIPCSGRLMFEGSFGDVPYEDYKQVLYDLAKLNDCALLDFDKAFGGYYVAAENGILFDDVHPNQKGIDLMTDLVTQVLSPGALPFRMFKVRHARTVNFYRDMLINIPGILGKVIMESPIFFSNVLNGVTADGYDDYLKISKLRVVGTDNFNYIEADAYGDSGGSVITLKDRTNSLVFQMYNAYGANRIYSGGALEIDTFNADKTNNPTIIKNRLQVERGVTMLTMAAADASTNTMFVDSADNVLKFKDISGTVKVVNLT